MIFKADIQGKATLLQKYIAIAKETAFAKFAGSIRRVELSFIAPLIGQELYDKLNVWYNFETPEDNAALTALLPYVQEPVANLAYLFAFEMLSVKTSDSGIVRIEKDNEKPLYQYQERNLKLALKENGFNALDSLLAFLMADQKKETPDYPEFANYSGKHKRNLINTAKNFDEFYPINNSHLVFKKLTYYIELSQNFDIAPKISKVYLDELLSEIKAGNVSENNLKILDTLQSAVAWFAISRGSSVMNYDITERGFYYSEIMDNVLNNATAKIPDVTALDRLVKTTRTTAENFLQSAIDYMATYPDLFPTYKAEILDKYSTSSFNNDNRKTYSFL